MLLDESDEGTGMSFVVWTDFEAHFIALPVSHAKNPLAFSEMMHLILFQPYSVFISLIDGTASIKSSTHFHTSCQGTRLGIYEGTDSNKTPTNAT
jgi:hypothetical protein